MAKDVYRILLAGEGGQGIQTIAHVLAIAAFNDNLNVTFMPNYGVEQRGGVSIAYIQIGKGVIGFPKFSTADVIVNVRSRAIERIDEYVGPETLYLYDSDLIRASELKHVSAEKLAVPATSVASKKLSGKVFNMILLGALISEIGMPSKEAVEIALEEHLKAKYLQHPELRHLNKKAIELGQLMAKDAFKLKK